MEELYFHFEAQKCVGCHACQLACQVHNGPQENGKWRKIFRGQEDPIIGQASLYLSMACNHCSEAPCLKACPAKAIYRSDKSGAILIDEKKCIGCNYCIWNCPYEAPVFDPGTGTMKKCHFCEDRLLKNEAPACVSLCPTAALNLQKTADLNNLRQPFDQGMHPFPRMEISATSYHSGPELDPALYPEIAIEQKRSQSDLKMKKEWPLLLFTFIIPVVVALTTLDQELFPFLPNSVIWLMISLLAAGSSFFHLGKKMRAWRAILNVRHSWLSREIIFLGTFIFGLFLNVFIDLPALMLLILAFPLLFSIDRLYKNVQQHWQLSLHSGQSLFITLSMILLLQDQVQLFIIIAALRLILYLLHIPSKEKKKLARILLHAVRINTLVLTTISMAYDYPLPQTLIIFLLGEFIDRTLFYSHLKLPSVSEMWSKSIFAKNILTGK